MHSLRSVPLALAQSLVVAVALCIAALLPARASCAGCADYSQYMHWNTLGNTGTVYGVAVEGDYAYLAHPSVGLRVADITDPDGPALVGALPDTAINGRYVVLRDTLAYVADYDYGVRVVSIANPSSPVIVGNVALGGHAQGLALHDGHLYVAARIGGLYILSLAVPDQPEVVSNILLPDRPTRVVVEDSIAYVAEETYGYVYTVDVADPANPQILGSLMLGNSLYGLVKVGSELYVSGEYHLYAVDVSDPATPSMVNSVGQRAYGGDVTVAGALLYVADGDDDVLLYDISSPTAPEHYGRIWISYVNNHAVAVSGGYCYVGAGGLAVIETGNGEFLRPLADKAHPLQAIEAFGDGYAFGVDGRTCLTYDIADPLSPIALGSDSMSTYLMAGEVTSLDVSGKMSEATASNRTLGLAGGPDGLYVLDLSDPDSLESKGFLNMQGVYGIAARNNYAYVVGTYQVCEPFCIDVSYLDVIDVSVPEAPTRVASIPMTSAKSVSVSGDYVYVADVYEIKVLDIADPADPHLVGSGSCPYGADKIVVSGDRAYVGCYLRDYLQVYDATDPVGLEPLGGVALPAIKDIDVDPLGYYLYVSTVGGGLFTCDVWDPVNPAIIGALYTGTTLDQASVAGGCVLLATHNGLRVAPSQCPGYSAGIPWPNREQPGRTASAGLIKAFPNPIRDASTLVFNMANNGHARLSIYNVAGERVARLVDAHLSEGSHSAAFRAAGLPSGIYFATLEVGSRRLTQKLVVAK